MNLTPELSSYLDFLALPANTSHKGQNGKLLIIGGSELFHAASKWSLDTASKIVDMVIYSSASSNNELVREAKQNFWNGIIVERTEVENYFGEVDCVLIGPGMTRSQPRLVSQRSAIREGNFSWSAWENDTETIVNYLLGRYPQKKWVIDAGALQMVWPELLTETMIVTPHQGEWERLIRTVQEHHFEKNGETISEEIAKNELLNQGLTIIKKGQVDIVCNQTKVVEIVGGNAGMTKGGTGDVLAGLVAALYCTHDPLPAAVIASVVNKQAGENLYQKVGPYFNASDLVDAIPEALWNLKHSKK